MSAPTSDTESGHLMINSILATPSRYLTPMATASTRSNLPVDSVPVQSQSQPAVVEHTVGPDAAGNPPGLAPIFAALIGGRRQMGDSTPVQLLTASSPQARFGGTATGTNFSSASQNANDDHPTVNRVGLDITA